MNRYGCKVAKTHFNVSVGLGATGPISRTSDPHVPKSERPPPRCSTRKETMGEYGQRRCTPRRTAAADTPINLTQVVNVFCRPPTGRTSLPLATDCSRGPGGSPLVTGSVEHPRARDHWGPPPAPSMSSGPRHGCLLVPSLRSGLAPGHLGAPTAPTGTGVQQGVRQRRHVGYRANVTRVHRGASGRSGPPEARRNRRATWLPSRGPCDSNRPPALWHP